MFAAVCRNGLPAVVLAGALVACGALAAPDRAIAQAIVPMAFDVPAGPLSRALTTFGRQAGLQVAYLTVVSAGKESPGVHARILPEDALTRILQGTGLSYHFTNATTVTVADPSDVAATGDMLLVEAVPVSAAIQVAFAMWTYRAPMDARGDAWRSNR